MAGRRVSLSERHGMAQRSVFGSARDTRRPTWTAMGRNVVTDMRSVDETDCCSVATSPAERIGDMAAMASRPSSFGDLGG